LSEVILKIDGLTKHFGRITAVNDLSLEVGKGNIHGILGPNGSGKTTTLGIILNIIRPSGGQYYWFGQQPSKHLRRKIGSIIEVPIFYPYLTAVQNLRIIADIRNVAHADIKRVLKIVELEKRKNSRFNTYSLGMKQRLAIAGALIGDPEVLILDEPTNGLDPRGIAEIRELILKIASRGMTIILASHLLDEVQKVCTHVTVLDKGKKLHSGIVDEVLNESTLLEIACKDMEALHTVLKTYGEVEHFTEEAGIFVVKLKNMNGGAALNEYLFSKGIALSHINIRKKSLEKYFLDVLKDSV
jgi:ABC-type multidrug transport system ATPase subunit